MIFECERQVNSSLTKHSHQKISGLFRKKRLNELHYGDKIDELYAMMYKICNFKDNYFV